MTHPDQRLAIFLDVQNLYHSARAIYNARVNFQALMDLVLEKRHLVRALAYSVSGGVDEEKGFFDAMARIGYEIRTKDLQTFASGKQKGNMDMELAIDAMTMAPKLDAVVIGSGDGDFRVLVDYLKSQGVWVGVVAFGKSTSGKLIEAADYFYDLDTDTNKFLITRQSSDRQPRSQSRKQQ